MSASDFRKKISSGEFVVGKKGIESKTILLTEVSTNKKVKNAKKVITDTETFDSTLEYKFHEFLKSNHIEFELKKKFVIVDSFQNVNGKFAKITWTPDFYIEKLNLIIDTKGHATDTFNLKYKFFNALIPNCPRILFVKNQSKFNMALFIINKLAQNHIVDEKYYNSMRL